MKKIIICMALILAMTASASEFKVLQFEQAKELVALESMGADLFSYRVGQEVSFKFENGNLCLLTITKVVPDKSRMFANTAKCTNSNLLTKDNIIRTGVEDSFTLANEGKESKLPSINESWYTYWGFGAAKVKYPSDIQSSLDTINNHSGNNRSTLALDLFGFYWPLESKKTMIGFVINAVSDNYKPSGVDLTVNQYLYGFSTMTFFGPNIGSEWFLRGDIGIAKYLLDVTGVGSRITVSTKSGVGALVGGGYAWPIGTETRMLLNLNYGYRKVEGDATKTSALTLGFLF
jgi:hypothetical protein